MSGRTIWLSKDSEWHIREWIVTLGEEFGPVGPLVIDWLECRAKAQNDGGYVKAGIRAIARGVFSDAVTVGHVVSRSVTLGLLIEHEEDNGLFSARISWWQADQERSLAAQRKARQRAGNIEDSPSLSRSVTPSHGESRSVTNTGQDSTSTSSLRSEVPASPGPNDPIVEELCSLMSAGTRAAHGVAERSTVGRVTKGWRDACRALLEVDGYTVEQVRFAVEWVNRHHYWSKRVRSMPRLRSEMAQVAKELREQRGGQVVQLDPVKQARAERQARGVAAIERLARGDAA